MAFELPTFYDSIQQVVRPMDAGDTIPPAQIPISTKTGNVLQSVPDGLFVGSPVALASVLFVNGVTGVDAPTSGSMATPYRTIDFAIAQQVSVSVNNHLQTSTTLALQAGQTFPIVNDINLFGGTLTFAFYGDVNYGAFNGSPIGTGAEPAVMADLARPVLQPAVSLVNGLWHLAGVNVLGGSVSLLGVELSLPAAPAEPAIGLYSNSADFVRTLNYSTTGFLNLEGSIVNMTDITAFWGVLGVNSRSSTFTLIQYASQFQIGGVLMTAVNNPTTAQLTARQFFIKFYPDLVGNNQQQGVLLDTALTASAASGLLTALWADTESFVVETTKTNLGSFPIAFDLTFGLRNYLFGVTYDALNRPQNIIPSRTI